MFVPKTHNQQKMPKSPPKCLNSLSDFLGDLRSLVFPSQSKAAVHFHLSRPTITRYENGTHLAPLGYLACLAQLVEKSQAESVTMTYRETLLQEVNQAIRHFYQDIPFQDWEELYAVANDYWAEQKAKRKAPPPLDLSATETPRAKLIERLESPSYTELIGVEQHLNELLALLTSPDLPWLILIEGIGGLGKTSLADALSRRIIQKRLFPDFAWVSARQQIFNLRGQIKKTGSSSGSTVEVLINRLGEQLIPDIFKTDSLSPQQRQRIIHARLKQIPHFIVIDNLENVPDVETFLPILRELSNPTKFLLISRDSWYYEPGIYHFPLPELSEADALDFIRHEIREANLRYLQQAHNHSLRKIYETVGGNPLAIRLVLGQTQTFTLNTILNGLRKNRSQKVEALYDFIYYRTWEILDEATRHLFLTMLLTLDKGGSFEEIVELSELDEVTIYSSLTQLVALNLVNSSGDHNQRSYNLHNLTRSYLHTKIIFEAGAPAPTSLSPNDYRAVFKRSILKRIQTILAHTQQAQVILPVEIFQQTVNVLDYAFKFPEIWPETRTLLLTISSQIEQAGYRDEWIPYLEQGIYQGQQLNDNDVMAELNLQLGILRQLQGRYNEAQKHFELGYKHYKALADAHNQARALNLQALVAQRQRRFEEATNLIQSALALLAQDDTERAFSYFVLGMVALEEKNGQKAFNYLQQSFNLWEQDNNQRMMGRTLTLCGSALRQMEKHAKAIDTYNQALKLLETVNDPVHKAMAQMNLGNVLYEMSRFDEALELHLQAEPIFEKVQDLLHLAHVHHNIGMTRHCLKQWLWAETNCQQSKKLWEQLGNVERLANTMAEIGLIYRDQARFSEAQAIFQEALHRLEEIKGEPGYEQKHDMITNYLHRTQEMAIQRSKKIG
jgi:tetratricopeptide (TPR) repeat protein